MRKILSGLAAAVPLVIAMAAPVVAEVPDMRGAGEHTQHVGLHWILDAPTPPAEHAAVVCRYDVTSQKLLRMVIRQPVIFADVSAGARTQRVGWRALLQRANDPTGPWRTFDQTPLQKASATGKYPADLRPATASMPGNVALHAYYRVVYRLFWYGPDGTRVADRATHRPVLYGFVYGTSRGYFTDQCESKRGMSTAGTVLGDHTGRPGPHWVLDHFGPKPEYPAVTCEYDDKGTLQHLRIRRPIVFARDTGRGVQGADVAWVALIQATQQNSGTEAWTTIGQTTSTRRSATDVAWADFLPKIYTREGGGGGIGLRVVYRLTWYRSGTDVVTGQADHLVRWYSLDHHAGPSTWEDDYCYTLLA